MPLPHLLAIAAGGAVGALLRHAFTLSFPWNPASFPAATLAENVMGAFLLGLVLVSLIRSPRLGRCWGPFLATGILGSFTTFSTVSVEIVELFASGATATAAAYALASVTAGLAAAASGIALGAAVANRAGRRAS